MRGTVASRMRNLIRAGAITKAWEPVWFPVVEAFPPLVNTKVNRRAEAGRMPKITYPEDKFRKLFYERFETRQPLYLWGDHGSSPCDRFVDTCMQFAQEGLNDEEAVEKATGVLETLKKETTSARSKTDQFVNENKLEDTIDLEEDLIGSEYSELPGL